MATWDSADLLARCKQYANRPTTDAGMDDTLWYAFLAQGQRYWMQIIATHYPEANVGAPELMTTADSGVTYTVASYPIGHMEIRNGIAGDLLLPCADYEDGDYVAEGQTIRMPGSRARTFSAGLYARYVAEPGEMSASTQPVLKPSQARQLVVYRALILHAMRLGINPAPYQALEQTEAWGDPNTPGMVGLIPALKTQYHQNTSGFDPAAAAWYAPFRR
jgi:hypothetical protein